MRSEEKALTAAASQFNLPPDTEYIIGHNVDYDWNVIGAPPVNQWDVEPYFAKALPGMAQ